MSKSRKSETIRMRVTKSDNQFLGECLEYPVMTHGRNLEELAENMEKSLNLFLAGQKPNEAEEKSMTEDALISMKVTLTNTN